MKAVPILDESESAKAWSLLMCSLHMTHLTCKVEKQALMGKACAGISLYHRIVRKSYILKELFKLGKEVYQFVNFHH